jgi:hypothetical protein
LLTVARRSDDSLGFLRRLVVYVDGSKVAKIRPGQQADFAAEPGQHSVRVRMDFLWGGPIWVHTTADHDTLVTFRGSSSPRHLLRGLARLLRRSPLLWGVVVKPEDDFIGAGRRPA